MKHTTIISITALVLASNLGYSQQKNKTMNLVPPTAAKIPKVLEAHGQQRTDNYYWLNDRNNPEVIRYLEEENKYTNGMLAHTQSLQDKLFKEMKGRIKEQDESVPYYFNGYTYYTKYVVGGEYPIFCRKKGRDGGKEEILLDGNEMAKGHEYFSATPVQASPDNRFGMFAIDTVGRRLYTMMFKNLVTGEILPDRIEGVSGNAVWASDSKTVFYDIKDTVTLRDYRIMRYEVGGKEKKGTLVFEEQDETFSCYVGKTKSRKYLVIYSNSTLTTECRILEAEKPTEPFRVFQTRIRNHEYSIDHLNGKFYVMTNDQARNFRLMSCDETNTAMDLWEEVIPHREQVLLEGLELFNDFMVLAERKGGLPILRIINRTGDEHYLDFGEAAYDAYVGANPEYDTRTLRFQFNSMVTPESTFDYN
ncbi:MAG: oligopeptidase B, partial [Bacteroidia bacterium]